MLFSMGRRSALIALSLMLGACHTLPDSGNDKEAVSQQGPADYAANDLAYLTQLSLMRGHLFVGHELYKAGHIEHAKTHMKHPKSELYLSIVSAFELRGTVGFAAQLGALTEAVEAESALVSVESLYQALLRAISISESAIKPTTRQPSERLRLVANLLNIAAEEYGIAVVNGEMQNAHESQDALGFTTIAKAIIQNIDSDHPAPAYAKQAAQQQLASLDQHWPSLIPPNQLSTRAQAISVVATNVVELANGLD